MTVEIGGQLISFETGQIARQAAGAVIVKCADTHVFASACAAKEADPQADYFPLRVDYQERFSSAGKTIGGFIKREGRPTEREILVSRLIDRPLRPMFASGYHNEVQILSYVWSFDGQHNPDVLAICAASAALCISEIPLIKPIAAVRMGRIGEKFLINPTTEQMTRSKLDLVVAGNDQGILMVEGACQFLTEGELLEAIALAHSAIQEICRALSRWQSEVGKQKHFAKLAHLPSGLVDQMRAFAEAELRSTVRASTKEEHERAVHEIKSRAVQTAIAKGISEDVGQLKAAFSQVLYETLRERILSEQMRVDGRGLDAIRPIAIELALLPRAHGSCLFTRGETQTLAVCTLGGESMCQRFEGLAGDGARRFYLQYSFPPYCVGEIGRVGAPGRREVGHGKLAERALEPVLPKKSDFPYIVRLESNITESNGSSSMASVCGGCLALMDAGVPITRPIAGIAMGLIVEGERMAILSDILGVEDALGDMDFKVAGDRDSITALQMDIKIEGVSLEIIKVALEQAKQGRQHILETMHSACPTTRVDLSNFAPRIDRVQVSQNKIATIIGPGGKQIRAIQEQTGVEIDIDDSGLVCISAANGEALNMAKKIIEGLTAEVEIGTVYQGKVKSIAGFGAFVEILPNKEGLCHISELADRRVGTVDEVCQVGDELLVKVIDINERGQIKLSHKSARGMTPTSKL